jgi:hypothetical protein
VPTDPLELLDRQYNRLSGLEGARFVQELGRFHEFLTTGPQPVVDALAELRVEAEQLEREFNEHDRGLVPDLVAIKDELVARVPAVDDSGTPRPNGPLGAPSMQWAFGFANFDQVATDGPDQNIVRQGYDTTASSMLLRILEGKLRALQWMTVPDGPVPKSSETNLRPDLDDLARRVRNLSDEHRHAAQKFSAAVETDGGVQMLALDTAVAEMNPAPRSAETEADEHEWMNETFKRVMGGWHVMEKAAAGRPLDTSDSRTLEVLLEQLKPAAERVYEDARMKLAMAPPAPVPAQDYGARLRSWFGSSVYQMVGWPCVAAAIQQAVVADGKGLAVFIAVAVVGLLVPPALGPVSAISVTRANVAFIALASVAVLATLVAAGLGVALLVFAVVVLAFRAGQHSPVSRG